MGNTYVIGDKTILDGSRIVLSATSSIQSFLSLSNGIVVLVDSNEMVDGDRNIFCYTFEGEMKWRVQAPDKLHRTNYYTSIYLSDENRLQAFSKNGIEYTLNEEDGRIVKKDLIK